MYNVSNHSADFFLFPRSTSTNINYDTTSEHAVRISVRILEKENSNSLSCTCLFILFAQNWNRTEITQKCFMQKSHVQPN